MELKENVACYIRVSTKSQTKDDKYSIPEQIDILSNICKKNSWNPIFYKDLGISGQTISKRGEVKRLLDDCKRGLIKKVLVVDQDRLTRGNAGELQEIKDIFRENKVKLIFQNSELDLDNEDDDFMSDINGAFSKREIRMFAKRSARGKYQKAKQGKIPTSGFNIPYGYKLDNEDRLIINEEEASVVKYIFELITNQCIGCYKIADQLNLLGIPTKSKTHGKILKSRLNNMIFEPKWTRSSVYHIILKDLYYKDNYLLCGNSKYEFIEPVLVKKEPIITRELFEKAKFQLLKNKSFHGEPESNSVYILTGIMRCKNCNNAYTGGSYGKHNGRNLYYYRDQGKSKANKIHGIFCNSASIKKDLIEDTVKNDIKELLLNQDIIKECFSRPEEKDNFKIDEKIEAKTSEINNLLDLYAKNIVQEVKEDNLVNLLNKKNGELKKLKNLKNELEDRNNYMNNKVLKQNALNDFFNNILTGISKLNDWDWKSIILKLVDKIEVDSIGGYGKTNKLDIYIIYNFNKVTSDNFSHLSDKEHRSSP